MATTEDRVPLAEAYRRWTGHEPPAPLTPEQRADLDAKVEQAWADARRIYGDASLGRTEAA